MENHEPAWATSEPWRIDPEPVLTIDAGDVRGAVRMANGRVAILDADSGMIRFHDGVTGQRLPAGAPVVIRSPGHLRIGPGDTLYVWSDPWRGLTVVDSTGTRVRRENIGSMDQIEYLFAHPRPRTALLTSSRSLVTQGRFEFIPDEPLREGDPIPWITVVARLRLELDRADTLYSYVIDTDVRPGERVVLAPGPGEEELFTGRVTTQEFRRYEGVHLRRIVRASLPPPADTVSGEVTTRPLYSALFADRVGSVWMRLDARDGEFEDRYLVFNAEGRELGILTLPLPIDLLDAGQDYILGRVDERVVLMRLHRTGPESRGPP